MEYDGYDEIRDIETFIIEDKISVQPNHIFKVILIGSAGVGKSSLLLKASKSHFDNNHNATIGVEFGSILVKTTDKLVRLQTWDTGGMESFRSLTRIFYRGAHIILVVYDVGNLKSFTSIGEWLEEARQYAGTDIKAILVANKCDLPNKIVSKEMAMEFKRSQKLIGYIETSAKTGENVKEVIYTIIHRCLEL